MFIIYSKPDCPWCDRAKKLIVDLGHSYKEFTYGIEFTKEELKEMIPDGTPLTVPQIFYNQKYIGGYTQLVEYMEEHGIMGLQT